MSKANLMYKHAEEDSSGDEQDAAGTAPPTQPRAEKSSEKSADFTESKQDIGIAGKINRAPELPIIEKKNWLLNQYFVKQDWSACLSLIKELVDESAGNCEFAFYIRGLILRQEGKIQESLDNFQSCIKIDPFNVSYIKNLAQNFLLLSKNKQALKALDEAARISGNDWEVQYWYAMCYKSSSEYSKAKEHLKVAVGHSKREEPLLLLAEILVEENDIMTAIDCYKRILELSPENADYLTTLGLLYLKTDSQQQAFEAIGRALGFNPNHAGAILAAGSMIQKHGDYDVALTKYRVAAQQWPDNAQLWSNIGMCFHGKKKYVAAISCLKRANYLAPFDWKILYNLGLVHYEMQQYASAYHFLSSSISINPKVGQIYSMLATVLTKLTDNANAEKAYEHALKYDQTNPIIALNFAVFLHKHSTLEKAKKMLEHYNFRINSYKEQRAGEKISREATDMADRLSKVLNVNN